MEGRSINLLLPYTPHHFSRALSKLCSIVLSLSLIYKNKNAYLLFCLLVYLAKLESSLLIAASPKHHSAA